MKQPQIDIYTRDSCQFCEKALEILKRYSLVYKQHTVGADISRDNVLTKFPGATVLPIITIDGIRFDYTAFIKWIATTDLSKFTEIK